MTNINLFESAQGKNNSKQGGNFGGGRVFRVPIIVLVSVFAIFGGLKLYLAYLSGAEKKVEAEIAVQAETLKGKNVDRVADFSERLPKALEESSLRSDYSEYLRELEGLIVSGARVESFDYSAENSEIKIIADNFKTVSRQALSFKNSKNFKELNVKETSRDKDGNIRLDLVK